MTTESGIVLPDNYTYFVKPNLYDLTNRQLKEKEELSEFINWGRRNPVLFAEEMYGIELMDYQKYIFMMSWNCPNVVWCMSRNGGKALSLDTKIPTPDGSYKLMKDLKVGDYVLGNDGIPTKIISISDVFENHDCYKITFSDNETIIADANHLWNVNYKCRTLKADECKTLCTEDMYKNFVKYRKDNGYPEYKYRVPMCSPIQYEEKNLPIHPYILGLWLGDGAKRTGYITSNIKEYKEFIELIENTGYKVSSVRDDSKGHKLLTIANEFDVPLVTLLKENNLYMNKHIPTDYIISSVEQRLHLIQGLMDTDGYCDKSLGKCEFSQTDYNIIKNFQKILDSLGVKNTISNHRTKTSVDSEKYFDSYRCYFVMDKKLPCFKLKRKYNNLKEEITMKHKFKTIHNIEKVNSVKTKCISVDNKDKLYLCGERNTVTHNSILGSIFIMTKTLLIPNHKSYILCGVGSQSVEMFTKIEQFVNNQNPSFSTLTDFYRGELQKSAANSNGFVHNPASYKYSIYNDSQVFTLNGAYDNNRSITKFIKLAYLLRYIVIYSYHTKMVKRGRKLES